MKALKTLGIALVVIFASIMFARKEETTTTNGETITSTITQATKSQVPAEHRSALGKATTYATLMNFSKKRLYGQLTSEYGEKFSEEAAQYAIDNVKADWNKNALEKAKIYQGQMNMSVSRIYDQLVSEYGEQFTPEEAQYAINNL